MHSNITILNIAILNVFFLRLVLLSVILLSIVLLSPSAFSKGIYQSNEDFVQSVFNGSPPKVSLLWLNKQIKSQVRKILGEKSRQLRIRYWGKGYKTVWVLEEIGKEKLITMGFVIENSSLKKVKILAFRESRGWEVREDFFTEQFNDSRLQKNLSLDTKIDGISGATLSVRAVKKMASLALLFHQHSKFHTPIK